MTDDIDRLVELAGKATPGPWAIDRRLRAVFVVSGLDSPDERNVALSESGGTKDNAQADAEYIAAVSPDVLRALIERVKEAEGRGMSKDLANHWCNEVNGTERSLGQAIHASWCPVVDEEGPIAKTEARLRDLEARLRAAEEVVELARNLPVKHHFGCAVEPCTCAVAKVLAAFLAYDEAVERVKE